MRCHRCREVRGHDLGEADRQTLLKGYPDHSRVRKRSARAAVIDVNQTKQKGSAAPRASGSSESRSRPSVSATREVTLKTRPSQLPRAHEHYDPAMGTDQLRARVACRAASTALAAWPPAPGQPLQSLETRKRQRQVGSNKKIGAKRLGRAGGVPEMC